MSFEKTPTVDIGGMVQLDQGTASTVAGGAHMLANFMPLGSGALVDTAASFIDANTIKENLMLTWRTALAKKYQEATGKALHPEQLTGEEGQQKIEELMAIAPESVPAAIRERWENADDYAGKITKFLANNGVQMGLGTAGAFVAGVPGMLAVGGLGMMMPDIYPDQSFPDVSDVIAGIHTLAHNQKNEHDMDRVTADRSLVGLYLLLADENLIKDFGRDDLKEMLQNHMAEKQEKPYAETKLDKFIDKIDAEGAFTSYIEPNINYTGLPDHGYPSDLNTVVDSIEGQQDLGLALFEPEQFKHMLVQRSNDRAQQLAIREAGQKIYQGSNIQGTDGTNAPTPPVNHLSRNTTPSRN